MTRFTQINNRLKWMFIALLLTGCSDSSTKSEDETPTCQDECTAKDKKCDGNKVLVCGDQNQDSCLEWYASDQCTGETACLNGVCENKDQTISCTQQCTEAGQGKCVGSQISKCGNYNDDACLEWSTPEDCPEGSSCKNNSCEKDVVEPPACTDECSTFGETACEGNSIKTCGKFDDDDCLEWSEAVSCPEGSSCKIDSCEKDVVEPTTCTDECSNFGETACEGNSIKTCGKFDDDECLEWSEAVPCQSNQTCQDGSCAATHKPGEVSETLKASYYQYDSNQTFSPITEETVQNMKTIAEENKTRNEVSFMKIGGRHLDEDKTTILTCFSKSASTTTNLGSFTSLQSIIDAFQSSTFDSFGRNSDATGIYKTVTRSLMSNAFSIFSTSYFTPKNNLTTEIAAANPRFALIAIGDNDLTAYGKHKNNTSYDSSGEDQGYIGGAKFFFKDMQYLADSLQFNGIIPVFVGLAPRSETVKTYNQTTEEYEILDRDQPKYWVPMWDAVIRAVAGQYKMPYVNVLDSLRALDQSGIASDGISLSASESNNACDFSAEGLKNGANTYNLRVMQILQQTYDAYTSNTMTYEGIGLIPYQGQGSIADPWVITQIPYAKIADTSSEGSLNQIDKYTSCTVSYDKGAEHFYKLELTETKKLRFFALYGANDSASSSPDVDILILNSMTLDPKDEYDNVNSSYCGAFGDYIIEREMQPGTYYIVIDSRYKSEGEYLFGVVECDPNDTSCGTTQYTNK